MTPSDSDTPRHGYDFGSYVRSERPENEQLMQTVTETMFSPKEKDTASTLQQKIHRKLIQMVDLDEFKKLSKPELTKEIKTLIEKLVDQEDTTFGSQARRRLIDDLLDEMLGFGPLDKLMRDRSVGDIIVNGADQVYVERNGVLHESQVQFRDNEQLLNVIKRIVGLVGRRVDEQSPMVDARLPDGSRVNAIIPPLSVRGPSLSIRRFSQTAFLLKDLLGMKMFSEEMRTFFDAAVKSKCNIIISGGTGSGKTTFLNALSSLIPHNERIVTIEDSIELQLQQRHVVQLESRPPSVDGTGEITIRDLMRNSLRMRPDRIVIGECRGREALDMLQAMNTGHEGSMTTLHANSAQDALMRLESMIEMSGVQINQRTLRDQISSSINLIFQVERLMGGPRRITSVTEVVGMEGTQIVSQELFRFQQLGVNEEGVAFGKFRACGIVSELIGHFREYGIHLPSDFFRERDLMMA